MGLGERVGCVDPVRVLGKVTSAQIDKEKTVLELCFLSSGCGPSGWHLNDRENRDMSILGANAANGDGKSGHGDDGGGQG